MSVIGSVAYVAWLYGSMAVIGLAAMPLALLWRPAAAAAVTVWTRLAVLMLRLFCGVRVEFRGLEHLPSGPALIAAKHQAMLDTIAPFLVLDRPALVFKQELLKLPVYSFYALRAGHIPVDREAHARALKDMLRRGKQALAEGRSVVIFPEGTRAEPGAAPDYKPGVAALYRELGAPCVPVALNTGLFWPAHGLVRKPGVAVIEFLPPIPPGLSRAAFMAELEARIEPATAALIAEARAA